MLKKSERDFWLYPKLLLVGLACVALGIILSMWLPFNLAIILGFIPLLVLMGYAGYPLSYTQWLIRILITICAIIALEIIVYLAKRLF